MHKRWNKLLTTLKAQTFTKSWNQKRKNKDLGVVPGVPDIFLAE